MNFNDLYDLYVEIEKLDDFNFLLLCFLLSKRLRKISHDKEVKL